MVDMGSFRVTIVIENAARRGEKRSLTDVLVDTGSEFTWVPRPLLEALGIAPERAEHFVVADGRALTREIGFGIIHVGEWSTADDVVFAEPGDLILLGARSLEGLNLRIDPRRRKLVPAGPIIAAVA
jgi:predicted aspartyl protease